MNWRASKIYFSKTTVVNFETEYGVNNPGVVLYKVCVLCTDPHTKMATNFGHTCTLTSDPMVKWVKTFT